ncbi:hypothetical protein [Streptomyces huiliensis]|uniref:hypothetical protein n=1 Tax=Streptomyces huiliensis TaxID=2876027 RepID=UPI001CBF7204|nr:hypothetical protein [Streptomyces huiliensis]MBZ4319190.1 hypothetical protein [Streptomyces huiliensis]
MAVDPLLSHPDFTGADVAVMTEIENELADRLDMLGDDGDLIVVAGLVAARIVDAAVLEKIADDRSGAGRPLDLAAHGIPAEEFTRFQRLWYHFKVPYARASLVWWRLFCRAVGRGAAVDEALERMADGLSALHAPLPDALARAGAGAPGGTVVVTADETAGLRALTAAVRLDAPLVAVDDVHAAVTAGRELGLRVVTADPEAGPSPAGGRAALWLGPPAVLEGLPERARRDWAALPADEREALLAGFERRISSVERVRLFAGETLLDNRGVGAEMAACRALPPAEWSGTRLVLATLLWCWQEAGFVLQELNQSLLSFPALSLFLLRKSRGYAGLLGEAEPPEATAPDALAAARRLGGLRTRAEERYERCLHFDGSNWERREFLLPLSVYRRSARVPDGLPERLYAETGAEFTGRTGSAEEWDGFLERVLEAGSSPTRAMQAVAHWAADAEDLPVDMAVFTVPVGRKLLEPWTMEFTDLFCYTGFRSGFRPEEFGIANGRLLMYNVIAQRMRYNAVKKAQNYAPVMRFAPQGFNLPDIAVAEDAFHGGHAAAGIRLACRLPITVRYRDRDWNGLADVRLNRSAYSRENRFRPRDMVLGHRYTAWAKGLADATYRRGLSFDDKWTDKVKDLDL